jgi:chitinase
MKRFSYAAFACALMVAPSFALAGSIDGILTGSTFKRMFPRHVSFYGYKNLLQAANATRDFCASGDYATRIRECAAFLANAAHETGDGREIAEAGRNKCPDYCDNTQNGACALEPGKSYYGRGWLQISWNYNYCAASKFIFGDDGQALIKDPDSLERDPTLAARVSLWYWMTQSGAGQMSGHDCIVSGQGFGCTIRSINGDLECGGKNPAQVASRAERYVRFLKILSNGKVKPVGANAC